MSQVWTASLVPPSSPHVPQLGCCCHSAACPLGAEVLYVGLISPPYIHRRQAQLYLYFHQDVRVMEISEFRVLCWFK